MTDAQTSEAKTKKSAVADRQWIDAAGNEVANPTLATGFRYVDLALAAQHAATNPQGGTYAFVYQTKLPAGDPDGMLAIFGGLTKAGNIRNTLVNTPGADPNVDVIEAIAEWFQLLESGQWGEERVGGPGTRFNKDLLAQAIADVAGQPLGGEFHLARLKRLNDNDKVQDPDKKAGVMILYGTFALRAKAVKDRYEALVPAKATVVDIAAL